MPIADYVYNRLLINYIQQEQNIWALTFFSTYVVIFAKALDTTLLHYNIELHNKLPLRGTKSTLLSMYTHIPL